MSQSSKNMRAAALVRHLAPPRALCGHSDTAGSGKVSRFMNTDPENFIDLRSDTVTQPTAEMRQAMAECPVGDDVYGDDPTVNKLEALAANFLGKEASMYVPSGTMSNLIACMVHCKERGSELIAGDKCHILNYEQNGISQLAGIFPRAVPNNDDGTMDFNMIEAALRLQDDPHYGITRLICVENTHNMCGGTVIPLDYMKQLKELAVSYSLPVHLDGARICNAAVALGVEPRDICEHVDTVSLCLSKGLGAPVGSILAGPKDFIAKARRARKLLGGGMRQAGILAVCGIIAIETIYPRLKEDHRRAQLLHAGLSKIPHCIVDPCPSNMVFVDFNFDMLSSVKSDFDVSTEMQKHNLLCNSYGTGKLRLVINHQIDDSDIAAIVKFFRNLK